MTHSLNRPHITQQSSRDNYNFSEYWFERNIPVWLELFGSFAASKTRILEIGAFEGASTTWILDELISHAESHLVSIDTFQGSIEHAASSEFQSHLIGVEARFYENIRKSGKASQLTVMKSRSFDALVDLAQEPVELFNLIYIDGSHIASDVLGDAILSWRLLETGGFMVFDDYKWDKYVADYDNPRVAIDSFISCYYPEIEIVRVGYQVVIKKMNRTLPFIHIEATA